MGPVGALFVLWALLVSPAAGEEQGGAPPATSDPALSERVDVEVVNVDVVVVDRRGNRVTDLARDDFELEVDGRPVAVEYFSAPSRAAPGKLSTWCWSSR